VAARARRCGSAQAAAAVTVAHYNRRLPGHLPLHLLLSSASDADRRSHLKDTVAALRYLLMASSISRTYR
jgi:hypothetical protein